MQLSTYVHKLSGQLIWNKYYYAYNIQAQAGHTYAVIYICSCKK
jgi:hypothetical protein